MSARQVVTFGSCCQSSTFGGFWDLCSFSDQILASSQSSTFGGFWDLDKIWSEKLHLFAQRISDVAYSVCSKCSSPSLGCLRALEPGMSEKCPKSVRKVSEKCPKSGPKSYIFSPNGFRTSRILGCGNPRVCSKCSRPSLGCLRALEPGRRDKTGRPKSYIFSPDFGFRTGFVRF